MTLAETKWTLPQSEAISHKGSSMIVSAAAGSGKTAVLVERVIRLMDETDIDRMLVVTFTNAAATSMKQRIHKAILKRLENPSSDKEVQHFNRQLSLLHNANINTLHAFCSKFVREHFDALNLSPSVKLGDTAKLNMMLSDAVSLAIDEAYESGDSDFLTYANELIGKPKDDIISETVSTLYPFLMSLPSPEKWLDFALSVYESGDCNSLLSAPSFTKTISYKLDHVYTIAKNNLEKVRDNPDYEYALLFFETDFEYAERLKNAFSKNCFTELEDELLNLPKRKAVLLKNGAKTEEIYEYLGALREQYKKALKTASDAISQVNTTQISEIINLQKPSIRAICNLVRRAIEIYDADKKDKELLDFNDLEHLTLKLLYDGEQPSELARSVSKEFDCIVVDEYQDINPVQEAIITALSQNQSNLFMVGDVKQGIYGFRNTVSELFTDKVNRYTKGDGGKCVYLSDNFRSRDGVLDFANLIFSQLMSPSLGGTPYTDTEALHKKGTFPEASELAEVYVLNDELFKKDTIEAEALFCASKIHQMISEKMQVTGKDGSLRPIEYGDIAILLRATKNVAGPFCETLTACGIPVYCDAIGENFLDNCEIQSLMSFLNAFSNPLQDIHLLSAFTSPIFGDPDYDLTVRIKLVDKNAPLYSCMKKYPETEEGYERVHEFLSFMEYWRKKAMHISPGKLISEFLAETGFSEYMEALKGGAQRLSNIRYLQSLADSSYPGSESGGLYSFLKYLDKHSKTKAGLSSPKILPDSADLVQVTTIHKSKGLEYPVVFLARAGQKFRLGASTSPILFHRDFGIGMPYKNVQKSIKAVSPVFKLIDSIKKSEELSEELRVLYVALTRAIDKTIVVGFPESLDKSLEYAKLSENSDEILLPEGVVAGGKSYLDWILCALNRKIITENSEIKVSYVNKITEFAKSDDFTSEVTAKEPSEAVCDRLSYVYPHIDKCDVFSKISVTELKRISEETDDSAYKPYAVRVPYVSFMDKNTAMKIGTITHYILENIDFNETDVLNTVNKMIESGRLTEEEAKLSDLDSIQRFLNSPLCSLLRQADEIYKELPFNIHIDGGKIKNEAMGENIQLQGTVDCLAVFGDSLLIVDFKTDRVTYENINERIENYRPQLLYYKKGIEKIFPEKDISGSIYFLAADHEEKLF